MSNDRADIVSSVRKAAADIGYIDCGITSAEPFERFENAVRDRMQRFPEAAPLYRQMLCRSDPRDTAPWARSIIVCVRRYGKYRIPEGLEAHIGKNYLADRRLPRCPDYPMPKRMTAALRDMGMKVKCGGTPDRLAAARAGVARIARNGFAYHPAAGSWLNINTWRVDADLAVDEPTLDCPCPRECRACMDACPTGAIVEPYVMRMDQCIAYLTYHAPQPVAADLWKKMGPWIYGCDVCQNVCPLNAGTWRPEEAAPWLDDIRDHLTPEALACMDGETYRNIVHPLLWYIPHDDLERWHRNARRALRYRVERQARQTHSERIAE